MAPSQCCFGSGDKHLAVHKISGRPCCLLSQKSANLSADSLAKLLDKMDGKMKQEGFVSLVRRAGKGIAIIVDEANLALPRDDDG